MSPYSPRDAGIALHNAWLLHARHSSEEKVTTTTNPTIIGEVASTAAYLDLLLQKLESACVCEFVCGLCRAPIATGISGCDAHMNEEEKCNDVIKICQWMGF